MSRVGLDWYKREPVAYLGDVQGLSSKEHAVYSVVIDLLYIHGGTIRNDPKFISGWIADMGAAAVRTSLAGLVANPSITLTISETEISQKRAKSEVKTKQKQNGIAADSGRIGGRLSADLRRQHNENNDIDQADASNEVQAEKRREEKSIKEDTKVSPKKQPKKSRIPEDAGITDRQIEIAAAEGHDLAEAQAQFERFKDHALANGKLYVDWDRAWRNWFRSEYFKPATGFMNGKGSRHGQRASARDIATAADQFLAELDLD